MSDKWLMVCQVWEWYGDENFEFGRYKAKGGDLFEFEMPYEDLYNIGEEELMRQWNEEYNQYGSWVRYEAKDIEPSNAVEKASYKDGKFTIIYQ